ncbi:MAG: hypothetical protein JWO20_1152 [Candidatus Angelobacter sp.]|nr:hypothetical protein [Candidatus Angelobacter sp.]
MFFAGSVGGGSLSLSTLLCIEFGFDLGVGDRENFRQSSLEILIFSVGLIALSLAAH